MTKATTNPIFLKLTPEGQAVASRLSVENISFKALLVSAGKRFGRQEVAASGEKDGKPVIEADAELVSTLAEDVRQYRRARPVSATEAAGAMSAAERELNFHREKNPHADFSAVERRIVAARTALKPLAFTDGADCRAVVDELGDVVAECRRIAVDNKAAHACALARSVGMTEQVEGEIATALAHPEFREQVNALGVLVKKLYGLGATTTATRSELETQRVVRSKRWERGWQTARGGNSRHA